MSIKKAYIALQRMREATSNNIPFSFSFVSCSQSQCSSTGFVDVNRAVLRPGLPTNMGIKSETLIAYYDLDKEKNGFFNLPLLMTYKGELLCQ